jgi:hypothetical protein
VALETNSIAKHKESFINQDGLRSLCYNLDFSILRKYRCFANCKSCYIKDSWITKDQLSAFVPKTKPLGRQLEKLLDVFRFFQIVSIIDDLRFIKDEHPEFFDFYKSHANYFHLGSMNDNAVLRHHLILKNDFHPLAVNEICLSDEFLSRIKGAELFGILEDIHHNSPIKKIKITSTGGVASSYFVKELKNWSIRQAIPTVEDKIYKEDIEAWTPKENSQVMFLMNDIFYPSLKSAIKLNSEKPLSILEDFDPRGFLYQVLSNKLHQYQAFAAGHASEPSGYYSYIADNLIVNENYNFLPKLVLGSFTNYYRSILDKGLATETKYGLLFGNMGANDKVIPLFEFKNKD